VGSEMCIRDRERPSKALIAFIEKAQQQKKERMKKMRDNFLKTQGA